MKSNVNLWYILGVFFLVVAGTYTVWNVVDHGGVEWVGTVALLFSFFMAVMVAWYLGRVNKSTGGVLPEDSLTADIDDGDPELGEFSPWSWWPLVLAFSAAVFMVGLAVGQFLLPVGIAIFAIAIVGWVYEYYRGYFAR
ncbi:MULTISPECIES: cytochrome c oxidase subunit 4 [Microbacterium]|uniref:cytochrome c oxidase subunit 4 n=1 Tax=Microbacterium TaxID=33882 RepID=UPI001E5D6687|nr:cytochrome c oxidase subunit 4 [Microbacterium nymphoidis]MCD2499230.1 cytochrome c oxidase subunit 4 [Microbacterium nymphoidis]